MPHCIETHSAEETRRWGERLGRLLAPGDCLALVGDLGAGKTSLAQGILSGLGVERPAKSPTFAIAHRYEGRGVPVYHLDVYRLDDPAALDDIGFDEMVAGDAVVLVEWADKTGRRLPDDHLRLELAAVLDGAGERRRICWTALGPRSAQLAAQLEAGA